MTSEPGQSLRFQRQFDLPPDRMFELWTEPEAVKRWFGGSGTLVKDVEIDLRVGGSYRIIVQVETGEMVVYGQFQEVRPPKELVYTWTMESPQVRSPETTVRVEFHAKESGTELTLTHGPFTLPELQQLHAQGWEACFEALKTLK